MQHVDLAPRVGFYPLHSLPARRVVDTFLENVNQNQERLRDTDISLSETAWNPLVGTTLGRRLFCTISICLLLAGKWKTKDPK